MNNYVVTSFGQTVLDSQNESQKKQLAKVISPQDPEETQIIESFEGDCDQCEQEKLKKPCTICEE